MMQDDSGGDDDDVDNRRESGLSQEVTSCWADMK